MAKKHGMIKRTSELKRREKREIKEIKKLERKSKVGSDSS
jgi:hypothetical protein